MATENTYPEEYTVFEDDQVLTPGQLNEIPRYFERQIRRSRTCLTGVGIACGLDVIAEGSSIRITKGAALTSDGDLLSFDADRVYTHFREFKDREALYALFRKGSEGNDEGPIPLLELAEAADGGEWKPLGSLEAFNAYVALLYLEAYDEDIDLCTGTSCDNKGKVRRNNLKALLVLDTDAASRLKKGSPSNTPANVLPDLAADRLLLKPDDMKRYDSLAIAYADTVQKTLKKAVSAITQIAVWCQPFVRGLYGSGEPAASWQKRFAEVDLAVQRKDQGIQYAYDFMADLADAYEELRTALAADRTSCCPDVNLFPKHVLLGRVIPVPSEDSALFRHEFLPAVVLTEWAEHAAKVRFMFQRIDRMVMTFELPATTASIKITPSRSLSSALGDRALPYYYRTGGEETINRVWNYELSRRKRSGTILSYHADKYSGTDSVINPLRYRIHEYDFFRIEGHLGKDVEKVEEELKFLIQEYDLPFTVITLAFDDDVPLKPPKRPPWRGPLVIPYVMYREELRNHIKDAREFTSVLKNKLETGVQEKKLPAEKKYIDYDKYAKTDIGKVQTRLENLEKDLNRTPEELDHEAFEGAFEEVRQDIAAINRNTRRVIYQTSFTPFEALINSLKYKQFSRLGDLLKKDREQVAASQLFSAFLGNYPGIEHAGGVSRGGTFILVSSTARSNMVVADFFLSSIFCGPGKEEAETEVGKIEKPSWVLGNDLDVVIGIDKEDLGEAVAGWNANLGDLVYKKDIAGMIEDIWLKRIKDLVLVKDISPLVDDLWNEKFLDFARKEDIRTLVETVLDAKLADVISASDLLALKNELLGTLPTKDAVTGQIKTALADYARASDIKPAIDTAINLLWGDINKQFEGFVSDAELQSAMSNVKAGMTNDMNAKFSDFAKNYVSVGDLTTKLAGYATLTYLDTAINTAKSNITNDINAKMTDNLKSYVTSADLTNKLASYATLTALQDSITAAKTSMSTELTNQLADYATTASVTKQISSNLATVSKDFVSLAEFSNFKTTLGR